MFENIYVHVRCILCLRVFAWALKQIAFVEYAFYATRFLSGFARACVSARVRACPRACPVVYASLCVRACVRAQQDDATATLNSLACVLRPTTA